MLKRKDIITVMLFSLLLFFSVYKHELWGDELQAWSIARSSEGLLDLYYNLRYEGNAGLWHLFLYILSFLSRSPVVMQLFNIVITITAVYIFNKFSNFEFWQKLLFTFSYFPLYEYGTISRNYALGMLFLFAVCALFNYRYQKLFLVSLLILLLSFTGPYGAMLAFAYTVTLIYDWLFVSKERVSLSIFAPNVLLMLFAIVFSFTLAIPPKDGSHVYQLERTYKDIKLFRESVATVYNSYVPIPEDKYISWNSNVIKSLNVRFLLSALILVSTGLFLLRYRVALIFYGISTFSLLAFSYTKFSGAVRHQGHLFLALIAAFWLIQYYEKEKTRFAVVRNTFFGLLLISQVVASAYSFYKDVKYPFYFAEAAAAYIQENNMQDWHLVGDDDAGTNDVAMLLDREIYFPKTKRTGTFLIFDEKRALKVTDEKRTLKYLTDRYLDRGDNILLISTYVVDENLHPVTFLASFGDSVALRRTIYLYKFDPQN